MTGLFPRTIETDRLRLEPRTPEHVDVHAAYRICSADDGIGEVTEYVTWDPHDHPKETHEFLERGRKKREENGTAAYAIRPREGEDGAGALAGFAGLSVDWDTRRGDLGIWLRKRFWGRGYAGERAAALFELAFDRLDLEVVRVTHDPENEQSRRAIEKYVDRFGGRREGTFRNFLAYADGTVHDQVSYSVTADEWRAAVDGMADPPTVRFG